jgi:predicted nucleic acid-binding protein
MSRLVVDASVAAKWLVPEPLSDKALAILDGANDLIAPDLFLPEVGNILWKKVRAGDLTEPMAVERFRAVQGMGIRLVATVSLALRALTLALKTGRTVYDTLYLALAESEDCPFVTADVRLVNALSPTPEGARTRWLGAF